jgi:hypothetical protein
LINNEPVAVCQWYTLSSIETGIELFGAELNWFFATLAGKRRWTKTLVAIHLNCQDEAVHSLDLVDTCGSVFALVIDAVVDVGLTAIPFESLRANAGETSLLENFAETLIQAWVAEASINLVLATLAMKSDGTGASKRTRRATHT